MKNWVCWIAVGVGSCAGWSLGPSVRGADEAEEGRPAAKRPDSVIIQRARDELLDLERKLQAVERRALARVKAEEERLESLAFQKLTAIRAVEVLKDEVVRHEKELGAKKENLAREEKDLLKLQLEEKGLLDPLRSALDRFERHIDSGIPWMKELRKSHVAPVRELVSGPEPEPARALQAIGRMQESEEALARTVEPGFVEVEIQGERKALPAFHLGLLAVIFSSEDGSVRGFVERGQKVEAGPEQVQVGPEVDTGYKTALDILRRRLTPRIVDLYIPSLKTGSEESR
ncbi:MAG TPA: DUF3450 family protein [Planctomycetota bacterium]|nr:DUF3450 family protein [Planctomycetota bacterium]